MKIYNYTGRDIKIYDREDVICRGKRLYLRNEFTKPKFIITNCGDSPVVESVIENQYIGRMYIPVQKFVDALPLETFCPNFNFQEDIMIAPNVWISVTRAQGLVPTYTQLASVYSLVYSENRTIGCLGLEFK